MTFGPVDGQPEKWVLVLLSLLFRWKFMWTPPEKNRKIFQNGDLRLTDRFSDNLYFFCNIKPKIGYF